MVLKISDYKKHGIRDKNLFIENMNTVCKYQINKKTTSFILKGKTAFLQRKF